MSIGLICPFKEHLMTRRSIVVYGQTGFSIPTPLSPDTQELPSLNSEIHNPKIQVSSCQKDILAVTSPETKNPQRER